MVTPPQIRDYLNAAGFDFGKYIAYPLTSIGTTLKRMLPFEVETKTLDNGQAAYRLRNFHPYSRFVSVAALAGPDPEKLPREDAMRQAMGRKKK